MPFSGAIKMSDYFLTNCKICNPAAKLVHFTTLPSGKIQVISLPEYYGYIFSRIFLTQLIHYISCIFSCFRNMKKSRVYKINILLVFFI